MIATPDLNGLGKLEVVVGSNYYEGEAITIYRSEPKSGGLTFCVLRIVITNDRST